jgi:peptide/nickel transport system permease protein
MLTEPTAGQTRRARRYRRGSTGTRLDPLVACCGVVLLFMVLAAIFAPWIVNHDPTQGRLPVALKGPGYSDPAQGHFLLGTDELGRDIFSRLVYGIRPLGQVVLISVALASAFGFVWGILAGMTKPTLGQVMMRIADMQLAVPPVILAIVLAAALSTGLSSVIIAIALATWPQTARVVRSEVMRVRISEYVQLARVAGLRSRQVVWHHVVPNVLNTFVVMCTLNLSNAVIFAAALSFLGIGVQADSPSWGQMLAEGTSYLEAAWWMVVMPGVAITLLVLSLNVMGDYVRDRLDPRYKK